MNKPNNPTAFPVSHLHAITEIRDREIERDNEGQRGMTLRDYFAAKAMQGMLSNPYTPERIEEKKIDRTQAAEVVATYAYGIADAMLEERGK